MITLELIRHGATRGNEKKRYIGALTDEPLSPAGREELRFADYARCGLLFVSPMRRCIQTAELLFPGQKQILVEELRECRFGSFENKNARELAGDSAYQAWIDSGGTLPFPGGESREEFARRNIRGFLRAVDEVISQRAKSAAFVVHGGTIMNVLEAFGVPRQEFYAYHTENGCGYEAVLDEKRWITGERELFGIRKRNLSGRCE